MIAEIRLQQLQTDYITVCSWKSVCLHSVSPDPAPARHDSKTSAVRFHSWSLATIDAILALRLLSEIHREFDRPLQVAYRDIKAAFDSVDRQALWKALRSRGVPDIVLNLIEALYHSTGARIRYGKNVYSWFPTTSGVRQGCILAPALFCVAIDWVIDHMANKPGIFVGNSQFTDLVYADDTTLLVQSPTAADTCLSSFSEAASTLGLRISWPKTKVQNVGAGNHTPTDITVDGNLVECVEGFVYLGSVQPSEGQCLPDIKRRIALASSVMASLSKICETSAYH